MTMRYSHLSPKHQLEAVQRLDEPSSDTRTDTTILTAALGRDNGAISLLASGSDGSRTLDRSGARAIRTDRGYGIGLSGNAGLPIFLLAIAETR